MTASKTPDTAKQPGGCATRLVKLVSALVAWALFIGYVVGLFWLSAQKGLKTPNWNGSDKVAHFTAYFGLCVVSRLAFGTMTSRRWLAILVAVAFTLIYGATDEWHQTMVPTRSPDIYDWVAYAAGGIIAGTFLFALERKRRARRTI